MLRVRNIRLSPGENENNLVFIIAKRLGVDTKSINDFNIFRKSIDARKKDDIKIVYTIDVSLKINEDHVLRRARNVEKAEQQKYIVPKPRYSSVDCPVIVGFGPAGIFAGLILAMAGLCPIIIERGGNVDERTTAVHKFFENGNLSPECNVQFGEGGAGAFSDGKLNTGINDIRSGFVLHELVDAGASKNILFDSKPHIGTDVLRNVVKNLRNKIISLGGQVFFHTKLTGLRIDCGCLTGAVINNADIIPCSHLILATGHSSRDTLQALHHQGVSMEPKSFSMGVRIEHLQKDISFFQYGKFASELPPADYKLNTRLADGSSAYTFCMCPGGFVIAASSEPHRLCTNGMSYSDRGGENANSALLVTLTTDMFPDKSPLGGMYWQQEVESLAFSAGGNNYYAPAQLVGDFILGRKSTCCGKVKPTYKPGVTWCNLNDVLPDAICRTLSAAIPELDKKLKGFSDPEAVLTAAETRSSSPVRIIRGKDCQSSVKGLYPCGEGAGYAGGIVSAAVDGIRCAEALMLS